ncbi:hypothetical protein CVT24_011969 [Panaeolus cyanescens]|uniref:SnoaL-like domain-containing protein n=1 Tax=Panaeolus cyanescens TaxID=181874 RepID=A0A409VYW3_9AGAR|nr:hypothetical protein CVT24_011969 [Panaeolus cyanescens]
MITPKTVALKFLEQRRQDRESILSTEIISPEAVWWSNGVEGKVTRSGTKLFAHQAASYLHTSLTYKVDERFELLDVITDGKEKVVMELVVTADGPLGPAGNIYKAHTVIIYTIRNGEIVELREHNDNMSVIEFIGEELVREEAKFNSGFPNIDSITQT